MASISAEHLCTSINEQISSLRFNYEVHTSFQSLAVADYAAIRFPESAGGGIAEGSASWIRSKHSGGGLHEPGLVAALVAIEKSAVPVNTVFDIGALYGYFSLLSSAIFSNALVHAFEVNPNSYRALSNNIAANLTGVGSSINAHHCALADESAMASQLRVHAFTVEKVTEIVNESMQGIVSEIDVWSVDDFCSHKSLSPNIIKIDVEGYQAKIIPGMMQTISKSRPIVLLEFDGVGSDNNFGVSNKEVIEPVIDLGYQLIWGRHRSKDAQFNLLQWDDLSDSHEINSLGILVP